MLSMSAKRSLLTDDVDIQHILVLGKPREISPVMKENNYFCLKVFHYRRGVRFPEVYERFTTD